MNQIELSKILSKYVECDYALGDTSKGFDCLSMILDYIEKLGLNPINEWNGWTRENYAERWMRGGGRKEFLEFLTGLGRQIDKNLIQAGDLVIFGGDERWNGPGIYIGNGNVVRIFLSESDIQGGKVFPLKLYANTVLEVRRLI